MGICFYKFCFVSLGALFGCNHSSLGVCPYSHANLVYKTDGTVLRRDGCEAGEDERAGEGHSSTKCPAEKTQITATQRHTAHLGKHLRRVPIRSIKRCMNVVSFQKMNAKGRFKGEGKAKEDVELVCATEQKLFPKK